MTLKEMQERFKALQTETDGLVAKPDLSDEDTARLGKINAERAGLKTRIGTLQEAEGLNAWGGQSAGRVAAPAAVETLDPPAERERIPAVPRRHYNLKSFRGQEPGEDPPEKRAYDSGLFLAATVFGLGWARRKCQERGIPLYAIAQQEGEDSLGGFLVPTPLERAIITLRDEFGVWRRYSRRRGMTSDVDEIVRCTGGLTAFAVGEGVSLTESNKVWDKIALHAKRVGVLARYSNMLSEDAIINMADDLTLDAARALAVWEDGCGFNGTGLATEAGIVGIVTKLTAGIVGVGPYLGRIMPGAAIDHMIDITGAVLSAVEAALPEWAFKMGEPKWFCSRAFKAMVFDRLAAAAGGTTRREMAQAASPRYFDYEIITTPSLPSVVATNYNLTCMCLFGDLALATSFGDRSGMTVQKLGELYALAGQVGLIVEERCDILVHDIGDTVVAGAVVGLFGQT